MLPKHPKPTEWPNAGTQHRRHCKKEKWRTGQEGMIKLRRLSQKFQQVTREKESNHKRQYILDGVPLALATELCHANKEMR